MADRKQTPDILGEILGETPVAQTSKPFPSGSSAAASTLAPRGRSAGTGVGSDGHRARLAANQPAVVPAPMTAAPETWEYLVISFQEYHGWRPRFANGEELEDWRELPPVHEYAGRLGEGGWELTAASAGINLYGPADGLQLYFKRKKAENASGALGAELD